MVVQLADDDKAHAGLVQRCYPAQPPQVYALDGSQQSSGDAFNFAHVHWLRSQGSNTGLLDMFQVARSGFAKLQSDILCLVADLVSSNASLLPCIQNDAWWQALHHDACRFFRAQPTRPGA